MSVLPYAGSGYFSIFCRCRRHPRLRSFVSFWRRRLAAIRAARGAGASPSRRLYQNFQCGGVNTTEIAGTFLAAGSMTIWIFNFAATLYVSLGEDNGNMYGEAIFTFSFSAGFIDYSYSVTASHNQPQLGTGDGSSSRSELEPGLLGPFTRLRRSTTATLSAMRTVRLWSRRPPPSPVGSHPLRLGLRPISTLRTSSPRRPASRRTGRNSPRTLISTSCNRRLVMATPSFQRRSTRSRPQRRRQHTGRR